MDENGSNGSRAGPKRSCDSAGRAILKGPRSVALPKRLASNGCGIDEATDAVPVVSGLYITSDPAEVTGVDPDASFLTLAAMDDAWVELGRDSEAEVDMAK